MSTDNARLVPLLSRRNVCRASGALAVAAMAGCLADETSREPVPDPVSVAGEACDACGMIIGDHFGPNAQIHYEGDDPPADREGPVWFDSLNEALAFHEMAAHRQARKHVMYVVDYSITDWTVTTHHDAPRLSSHTEPEAFLDIRETICVVGSEVHGAMGPDAIPFSRQADAADFSADYGGDLTEGSALLEEVS